MAKPAAAAPAEPTKKQPVAIADRLNRLEALVEEIHAKVAVLWAESCVNGNGERG